jgi:hypothetical protein
MGMVHLKKKQLDCPREHGTFRKEAVRMSQGARYFRKEEVKSVPGSMVHLERKKLGG